MPVATSQTLTPIEQAWLRIQTPENPTVTTIGLACEGSIDPVELRSRIEDRLLSEIRLRQRVDFPHRPLARPVWQELERFELADHFSVATYSDETLQQVLDRIGCQLLDEDLPLWQVHLANFEDGTSAVLFRLHAAVADSKAAMSMGLQLLDAESEDATQRSAIGFEHRAPLGALRERGGKSATATRVLAHLIASRRDRDNPFRHSGTGSCITAWSEPVDLANVLSQAEASGCTETDVVVSAVATGLRREAHRRDLPAEDLKLQAFISIDLRMPGDRLAGTRLALAMLPLPVGAISRAERLEAVHSEIERLSLAEERFAVLGLETGMTLSMSELEERSVRLMTHKASAALAIFDGPAVAQSLCGHPVSRLIWQRAMPGQIALSLSLINYAGQVHFGVSVDRAVEVDPALLAADMGAAAAEI